MADTSQPERLLWLLLPGTPAQRITVSSSSNPSSSSDAREQVPNSPHRVAAETAAASLTSRRRNLRPGMGRLDRATTLGVDQTPGITLQICDLYTDAT
jgi:hypothetical protein